MSESEDDDKPFDASEQKLRRAREQGDIPRSPELSSALAYLGLWGALTLAGWVLVPDWVAMAARALGAEPWPDGRGKPALDLARGIAADAGWAMLAVLAVIALPILLGLIAQRAVIFSPGKLIPDLNRINPVKNAGQKFGKSGLMGFVIALGKAGAVAAGGWLLYRALMNRVLSSDQAAQWVPGLGVLTRRALLLALATGAVFAAIDLLWKRFEYLRRQRMSRKEMQDEFKESEGDPHFRAARRQKGVDIVLSSMLADVEKADVVILNPTHYAVALEWKRGSGRAPVCLAKGVDEVARRIRERATQHGVPMWSDPPCARALHATVEIGQEIRAEQFAPVAAAIRFAEAMRRKARAGWTLPPRPPKGPGR